MSPTIVTVAAPPGGVNCAAKKQHVRMLHSPHLPVMLSLMLYSVCQHLIVCASICMMICRILPAAAAAHLYQRGLLDQQACDGGKQQSGRLWRQDLLQGHPSPRRAIKLSSQLQGPCCCERFGQHYGSVSAGAVLKDDHHCCVAIHGR